jgi:hypothetical protein
LRKGAISLASSILDGPGASSIHLRAGWSLGNVQDRYIFADAGSDQFIGRCLNNFSLTETSFAILPPHFAPNQRLFETAVDENAGWASILHRHDELPMDFKSALRFLLASLVYHQDWIRANFSPQHPLFQSPVFAAGHVARLQPLVLIDEFQHPVSGLSSSGIPPSVSHLRELCEMKIELVALRATVNGRSDAVMARIDALPEQCAQVIMQQVRVDGAREVTAQDVSQIVSNQLLPIAQALNDLRIRGLQPAAPALGQDDAKQPAGDDVAQPDPTNPAFNLFNWGGKLCRLVNRGFEFPQYVWCI